MEIGLRCTRHNGDTIRIVILEDDPARTTEMTAVLQELLPAASTVFFEDAGVMHTWLAEHLGEVNLISLDHDLPIRRDEDNRLIDCGTGRQVADWLAARKPVCPVIVHSSNELCAAGMMFALRDGSWRCRRVYPRDDVEWIGREWAEMVRECLVG
jgi:CheY-like chemotaxis protein